MHDKELLQNSREFSEGAVAPFCFIQVKEYTGLGRIQRSVQKMIPAPSMRALPGDAAFVDVTGGIYEYIDC
jgi:hypothetical protein